MGCLGVKMLPSIPLNIFLPCFTVCDWHTHKHAPNQSHNLDGKRCAMAGAELVQCSLTSRANIVCHSFLPFIYSAPFQFALINNPDERWSRGAILKKYLFTLLYQRWNISHCGISGISNYTWFMNVQKQNVWVKGNYYFRISLSSTVAHEFLKLNLTHSLV